MCPKNKWLGLNCLLSFVCVLVVSHSNIQYNLWLGNATSRLGRWLSHKVPALEAWEPEIRSEAPRRKAGVAAHTHDSSYRKEDPWSSVCSKCSWIDQLPVLWGTVSQKIYIKWRSKKTPTVYLSGLHTCTCTHGHLCTHLQELAHTMHTHTHNKRKKIQHKTWECFGVWVRAIFI